tara:strand:- start:85 stop:333 length:249 start_codon:yes stop_codon:yes gene_type:complete
MKSVRIRAKRSVAEAVLYDEYEPIRMDGSENLTKTGAKIYYRGGGWWLVSGYDWDGVDVDHALFYMRLKRNMERYSRVFGDV